MNNGKLKPTRYHRVDGFASDKNANFCNYPFDCLTAGKLPAIPCDRWALPGISEHFRSSKLELKLDISMSTNWIC